MTAVLEIVKENGASAKMFTDPGFVETFSGAFKEYL